jgi:hypothetical protein
MVKTLWWRERLRPTILTRRLPSTEHSSNFPVCGSPILPRRWKVMGCWPSSWALRTMPQLFGPGHCQQWGSDPRPGRFGCRAIVHGRRCSLQVPRYRGPDARGHLHPLPFDLFSESNECVRSGWRFDSCGRDSRCGPASQTQQPPHKLRLLPMARSYHHVEGVSINITRLHTKVEKIPASQAKRLLSHLTQVNLPDWTTPGPVRF